LQPVISSYRKRQKPQEMRCSKDATQRGTLEFISIQPVSEHDYQG